MTFTARPLGVLIAVAFAALVAQLAAVALLRADGLRTHPSNTRPAATAITADRGDIVTADGVVVATSQPVESSGRTQRNYPFDSLYADTIGFISPATGAAGLELSFGGYLSGSMASVRYRRVTDLLTSSDNVGHLQLTLNHQLQSGAADALEEAASNSAAGTWVASALVVDARSGDLLALVSVPRPSPSVLARAGSRDDVLTTTDAYFSLSTRLGNPLASAAYQRTYRWQTSTHPSLLRPVQTAEVELQLRSGRPVGFTASPTTMASLALAAITGQPPRNLRLVSAVLAQSPIDPVAQQLPSEPDVIASFPPTLARLRSPSDEGQPGLAAALAAAPTATLTDGELAVFLNGTLTDGTWLGSGWTYASLASAGGTSFTIAITPPENPRFVALVVTELQADQQPGQSAGTALGTVTQQVAAGLLDAAVSAASAGLTPPSTDLRNTR